MNYDVPSQKNRRCELWVIAPKIEELHKHHYCMLVKYIFEDLFVSSKPQEYIGS